MQGKLKFINFRGKAHASKSAFSLDFTICGIILKEVPILYYRTPKSECFDYIVPLSKIWGGREGKGREEHLKFKS